MDEDRIKAARRELNSIWAEWGLEPESAVSDMQFKALPALVEWLAKGRHDPRRVIRAVQILLADPEKPGVCRRAAVKGLVEVLVDHWPNVGTGGGDLTLIQALLLATWPEGREGDFGLVPLLDSAWEVVQGREGQQDLIQSWRERVCAEDAAVHPRPEPWGSETPEVLSSVPNLSFDKEIRGILSSLKARADQNPAQNIQGLLNAKNLSDVLNAFFDNFNALDGYHEDFVSSLDELMDSSLQKMLDVYRSVAAQIDLLWWGQARYCHALRKPYRRIGDPGQILWWACREVAERARRLALEPSAAFLVETLDSLGQQVDERRPLGQWMVDLYQALVHAGEMAPEPCRRLSELVSHDALGLPVSWLRWHALKNVNPKMMLSEMTDAVALPLSAEIDRGQWAGWVLREILLDLRLEEMEGLEDEDREEDEE